MIKLQFTYLVLEQRVNYALLVTLVFDTNIQTVIWYFLYVQNNMSGHAGAACLLLCLSISTTFGNHERQRVRFDAILGQSFSEVRLHLNITRRTELEFLNFVTTFFILILLALLLRVQ